MKHNFMEKILNVIFNKRDRFYLILFMVFAITYIITLGAYPLLDLDETRYVTMARDMFQNHDYMTLYMNGNYFFEKPPLFFWLENFSFWLFDSIDEISARFPVVFLSLLPFSLLYALSEKIKNKKFAFLNCAILLTSLEYILITKMAILDGVLTSLVTSSVLCYFYTFFVEDKNKKYFWWLTYVFSALAVLAKGIPGVAIPAIIIIASSIIFKTQKETLKNLPIGIVLFLLIALPWHILMLNKYGSLFFDEYIIKHHIARFLGSEIINRQEPVWFYAVTLLWGLFPWVFSLVFDFISKVKNKKFKIDLSNNYNKFITLNIIAICSIFLFFTSSGTKLITYILPIFPFFAVIIGSIWYKYVFEKEEVKSVKYSIVLINSIFALVLLVAPFMGLFLPDDIYLKLKSIQILSIIIIGIYLIFSIISLKQNKKFNQFVSLIMFVACLFGIVTPFGYNLDYSFGQDDLMKYAKMAEANKLTISTYKTGQKYSLNYYSNLKKVPFQTDDDIDWLKNELKKQNHIVIMRNKDIQNLPIDIAIKEKGVKYSIVDNKE